MAEPGIQRREDPLLREIIGTILRTERELRGRTLTDLARSARVSFSYLSEVERGKKEPSGELLRAIHKALGISLRDVLGLCVGYLDVGTPARTEPPLRALLGSVLRAERLRQSLSIPAVARESGVSAAHVMEIEDGTTETRSEMIQAVHHMLGLSLFDVLHRARASLDGKSWVPAEQVPHRSGDLLRDVLHEALARACHITGQPLGPVQHKELGDATLAIVLRARGLTLDNLLGLALEGLQEQQAAGAVRLLPVVAPPPAAVPRTAAPVPAGPVVGGRDRTGGRASA